MIDRFSGAYRFLSNFYPASVTLDEVTYSSVEHAYQAAKTLDMAGRRAVAMATLPGLAKRVGRTLTLRADWEQVKVSIMRDLIAQKFADPALRARLLATGDQPLVEGNHWNDTFWGVCNGRGENWLGRLLMEERAKG